MFRINKSRITRANGTVRGGFSVAAAILAFLFCDTARGHGIRPRDEQNSRNLIETEPEWIVDHSNNTFFMAEDGNMVEGVRCGTPRPGAAFLQDQTIHQMIADSQANGVQLQGGAIRTVVHVICADDGRQCRASQKMVDDQMTVLNQDFAAYGFSFVHVDTVYTNKSAWLTVGVDSAKEAAMKKALAVDPATTFNVYATGLSNGLLGWATFPQMYPEDSFMHGVVLLGGSLPGGTAAPYNLGKTLVHEAGHYLGLFHTFESHQNSSGCKGPGDYVDDTPAERSPASGCPIGRDTCPGDGPDPIHNFMDYSSDACMTLFTQGQSLRMMAEVAMYKPSLLMSVTTQKPTSPPTMLPTKDPTSPPTMLPTKDPTSPPTMLPRKDPTSPPTILPNQDPTKVPTLSPTQVSMPTPKPTPKPTRRFAKATRVRTNRPTGNGTVFK